MKRKKMTLVNITERLSRAEMKNILAGDRDADAGGQCSLAGFGQPWPPCIVDKACVFSDGKEGKCGQNTAQTKCYCTGAF